MNSHANTAQPAFTSRQTPRLQNTSKTPVNSGWGLGFPSGGLANTGGGFGSVGLGSGIGSASSFGGAAMASGRPAQLSGFAQVMGGGGSNSIDMSDFPSLSGGAPQTNQATTPTNWNSSLLRTQQRAPPQAGLTSQRVPSTAPSQQSIDRLAQSSPDRRNNGEADDFPPLSGQPGFQSAGDMFTSSAAIRSPDSTQQLNGQGRGNAIPFRDGPMQNSQASLNHQISTTRQLSPPSQATTSLAPGSGTKRFADMSEKEKYGLEGLAAAYAARKAIESGQPVDESLPAIMRSGLFFGQDLNTLGMDLDSPDPIWPTLTAFPAATSQAQGAGSGGGIFDYHDRAIVPDFYIPQAYTVTNVPPLAGRLGSLSDETLFCIFYQNPRDLLQEQAAQELTIRDWRWHKVLRQWLQKDSQHSAAGNSTAGGGGNSSLPILDLTNGAPVGVPPQPVSRGVERGVYVFFDVMNWRRERREFVLAYDELDNRFAAVGMIGASLQGNGSATGMAGPVMPQGRESAMAAVA